MEISDNKFDNSMEQILKLLRELLKLMKAKNRLNGENILDNQDVCQMLRLSKRSLQRLRSLGLLSYMQIGQKTFYLESDIMGYIQKQKDDKKTLPKKRDDEIREGD
jgi:chromosome condensin MukBEF MukE localization factor